MAQRMLGATALVEQENPVLGSDLRPLLTEPSVRSAIQRVVRDLEDMSRKPIADGWEPVGEVEWTLHEVVPEPHPIEREAAHDPSPGWMVMGRLLLRRDVGDGRMG